jgi:hypothetical protein
MNVEKFIKNLKESESYKKFRDEMNETSTTGMVAGYDTPKAFAPQGGEDKESFDTKTKDNAEQFGYKIVPKQKRRNSISKEQYAKQESKKSKKSSVNEGSISINATDGDDIPFGYNGRAFKSIGDDDTFYKLNTRIANTGGYNVVEPRTSKSSNSGESSYKQAMRALYETSYKEYRGDKTKTTSEKINHSIKELNQSLLRVERAVGHALRLKTEMAVDQRTLWRSSHSRLVKIGERLNRIGKKINELGA